jgi:hypothetical protein
VEVVASGELKSKNQIKQALMNSTASIKTWRLVRLFMSFAEQHS